MTATGWALVGVVAFYALSAIAGLSGLTARLTAFWRAFEESNKNDH